MLYLYLLVIGMVATALDDVVCEGSTFYFGSQQLRVIVSRLGSGRSWSSMRELANCK